MSDQDLFQSQETETLDLNQIDDADQLLSHLTREDGTPRYKTVPDAVRAHIAAQDHIRKLEEENATFRSKQSESKVVEDILERMKPSEDSEQPQEPETSASPTEVDLTLIDQRVVEILSEKEQKALVETNRQSFSSLAREQFGENVSEQVYGTLAEKFGMSKAEVNADIDANPQKVIALLGLEQTPANRQQKSPSVNPSAIKEDKPVKGKAMQATTTAELVSEWRSHAN